MTTFFDSDYYKIGAPIVGYIGGLATLFITRFTLTKKEKSDLNQKVYENTRQLAQEQSDRFIEFNNAFSKYISKDGAPDLSDFISISTAGEKLFYQQSMTANAILANLVTKDARDSTFLPKLNDTINKTFPNYYKTLKQIADRNGFPYHGVNKRSNYESIYLAVEKFGAGNTRDISTTGE